MLASRNGALLFAAITIVSTMVLVGDEDNGGVLETTTERLTDQRGQMAERVRKFEQGSPSAPIILPYDPNDPIVGVNGSAPGNIEPDDRGTNFEISPGSIRNGPPVRLNLPPPASDRAIVQGLNGSANNGSDGPPSGPPGIPPSNDRPSPSLAFDEKVYGPMRPTYSGIATGPICPQGSRLSRSESAPAMTSKSTSSNDLAEKRTEFAEDRTDWAEDRTVQATERTYAGWLRTAFAAIGIGLGFRAVFGEFEPEWLAQAIASVFIALGGVVSFSAQRNACKSMSRLHTHDITAPRTLHMRWLSYIISAGAFTLLAALWLLHKEVAIT